MLQVLIYCINKGLRNIIRNVSSAGIDFVAINTTVSLLADPEAVLINVLDDMESENLHETFRVLASLEDATIGSNVRLTPNFIDIVILDNDDPVSGMLRLVDCAWSVYLLSFQCPLLLNHKT